MTCQHTMTLGVYLLGALDPAERFAFESHLSYCEICRGELVRLAPLPGLLNQITPEDFADSMPSTEVESFGGIITRAMPVVEPVRMPAQPLAEDPLPPLPPVAEEVQPPPNRPRNKPNESGPRRGPARRRAWRVVSAAATVVILAVGAVVGWQALRGGTEPPAAGVVWSGVSADGKVQIEARMVDHEWGTEIQSEVHGLPPGRACYLFVYDNYANRQVAGWWGTDHDPDEEIPGSTSIMRSKIDKLVYMLDDKETVVLTIEAPR